MGQLVAFDTLTNRWYNESINNGDFTSQVFAKGYDDPTYMTFKLEFGGWGYSSKDFAGVTALSRALNYNGDPDNYGSTRNFRYDDLPMGLLDPNFIDDDDFSYPSYAFNHQSVYNAYNYLKNRNEDSRANYIKDFIIGLYEIQHSFPYIFQNISGLNSLSNFSNKRGYRLKDAKLTIECQEGLSMKIRTLMELYKKAAWDEVYQRWILPENYRQFKLIIYVFERRTFHSMQDADVTSSTEENQSFGSLVVNFLASAASYSGTLAAVGTTAYIKPSYINMMLPIKAYECFPCEFNMDMKDEDSLNIGWNDDTPAKTTITIDVKNVKTYMSNKLMKRLNNYMIYDLASNIERSSLEEACSTISGSNINYLTKDIFYKDDLNNGVHQLGGGGNSSSSLEVKEQWNNMVNNWKTVFGKGSDSSVSSLNNSGSASALIEAESLADQREALPWWHEAVVSGPGDFKYGGNVFKYLWNLLKSGTQQIKVGPGYVDASSALFYNLMDFIDYHNSQALEYYSVATLKGRKDLEKLRNPREIPDNFEMVSLEDYREKPDNNLENDYNYRELPDDIPENNYDYREEPEYDLNQLLDPRDIPDQELTPGDDPRELPDQELTPQADPRDIPDYDMVNMDDYRENPEQTLTEQDDPRDIPDYDLVENNEYRENPDLTLTTPDEPRELPEYDMVNMGDYRDEYQYDLYNVDEYRELPEYAIDSSVSYRDLPDGTFTTQDDYRAIQSSEMASTQVYRDTNDLIQQQTSPFREKPTGITFETADGRSYDLYKVDDLITFDNTGRVLPNNVIVEKNEIISMLSKATSTHMTESFKNVNDAFTYTERMIKDMLENGDEIYKAYKEQGDDRKALAQAIIDFKNDTSLDAIIKRLQLLLKALKQLTELAARSLPDIPVSKATYQNEADTSKLFTLVPINAVKRIYDNMMLYSIDEPTLHKMSYQSLIAVNNELLRAITDSEAMVEVMLPDIISKATEGNQKIEDGKLTNNTKRKTKTGKNLIG